MKNFDENGMLVLKTPFPEIHQKRREVSTQLKTKVEEFIQDCVPGERIRLSDIRHLLGFKPGKYLYKLSQEGKVEWICEGRGHPIYIVIK